MKTFGKILLGLGGFVAGVYTGAFISAYVAEKVMDSPLDESVLRKHARTNKSKLDYTVLYTPKSSDPNLQSDEDATEDESVDDKSTYYDSLLAFLGVSNALFFVGEKVRIKMKDGVVLRYVRTNDGWVLDSSMPDPIHVSGIFYGDINLINFNHYNFHEGDLILNIPFLGDASEKAKLYKWHDGEPTNTGIMIDHSDEVVSYDDNDIIFADYKGPVKTFADLPKDPDLGDTFLVEDADNGKGCIYTYTKHGYVIPEVSDDVSLNDLFRVKNDVPQDDTDNDITTEESNS